MRYLKIFEEYNSNDNYLVYQYISDLKDNIKDILLSFTEAGGSTRGFNVNVKKGRTTGLDSLPYITLEIIPKNKVNPNGSMTKEDQITVTQDMIDDLSRLKYYMTELGFNNLTKCIVAYFSTNDGKPIPKYTEVNYGRGWLTAYYGTIEPGELTVSKYKPFSDKPAESESILNYDIISITLDFKPSQYNMVHKEVEIEGRVFPFSRVYNNNIR